MKYFLRFTLSSAQNYDFYSFLFFVFACCFKHLFVFCWLLRLIIYSFAHFSKNLPHRRALVIATMTPVSQIVEDEVDERSEDTPESW